MTGITPEISILPIEFEANLDGKITSIKKSSLLAEGQNVYDLEYLPEIEKAGIVRVDPAISKSTTSSMGESSPEVKPATEEELGEIINSTKVTDEELLGQGTAENPIIDFSKAKNMTELGKLTAEALIDNPELASEIADAYAAKQYELKTKISVDNLEVGELLMAKVPIFTNYENEFVFVTQVKGTNVIVKDSTTDKTKTFTEEEMKEMFIKTTKEAVENMNAPIVTQEDVANSEGTKDNFENFSKDSEEISKLEREADIISKDDIISKIQNNAKHC
jgi:hypothetical protein